MKKLSLLFVLLCVLTTVSAQQREVRAIEVELGVGLTSGAARLQDVGFDKNRTGETGFIEIRYNWKRLPIDVGFHIGGTIFGREMRESGEKLNFSSGNFMLTSDYNYRRDSNCSLFAGLGIGMATFGNSAELEYVGDGGYTDNGSSGSFCVMPRVGVELFHRLRLTCAYVIEEQANRHFSLTLGIAIGGGRK
ncbi:MAG: hypothetical protein NC250_00545 [Alistipes senegalensis]|nr:hypothetical protein [Bacteroides cellulosilyticus]MCM1351208.1 hypothetical protein [Alistipes senegalensis]